MLQRMFSWTPTNISIMKSMIRDGYSAARIAATLQCTRNAVIGKARRIGVALSTTKPRRTVSLASADSAIQAQAPKTTWNEERIARAAQLWEDGMLAKDIAAAVGCTPNAFLSLTDRFRDQFPKRGYQRSSTGPHVTAAHIAAVKASKTFAFDSIPFMLPEFPGVTLEHAEPHHCKFPVSNDAGKDLLYCGAPRLKGHYCSVHAVVMRGRGTESERKATSVGRVWR